jgi:hypothetical protein
MLRRPTSLSPRDRLSPNRPRRRQLYVTIAGVPDGFDVRPEQLRRGAADLRADADGLDAAALQAGAAVDQISEAAGPGPLAGAASELAAQLDRAVQTIRDSVTDCAAALEAADAQYLTSDTLASSGLDGVVLPGFDGPR